MQKGGGWTVNKPLPNTAEAFRPPNYEPEEIFTALPY